MSVKTTGAEFKRFYSDNQFWPDGIIHEGEEITADDNSVAEGSDYSEIPDGATVIVSNGVVITDDYEKEIGSFEGYFRKWRRKQDTEFLAVEVPKAKADAVREAIKAAGGKVVK